MDGTCQNFQSSQVIDQKKAKPDRADRHDQITDRLLTSLQPFDLYFFTTSEIQLLARLTSPYFLSSRAISSLLGILLAREDRKMGIAAVSHEFGRGKDSAREKSQEGRRRRPVLRIETSTPTKNMSRSDPPSPPPNPPPSPSRTIAFGDGRVD
jgi:hypothetical protein